MDAPLRIGIARCLLGDPVRPDGGHAAAPDLVEWLGARAELWSVCPEVEIGMGTPREALRLEVSAAGVPSGLHRVRLVGVDSGTSWTSRMQTWAARQARRWADAGVSGVVLVPDSPSCGPRGVPVASGRLVLAGRGLFAQALLEALPDIPMTEAGGLAAPAAREAFVAAARAARHRPGH